MAEPRIRVIWETGMRQDRMMRTNIFPTMTKILEISERGYRPMVYIISDMIQDYGGENFSTLFNGSGKADPLSYARGKVSEMNTVETLDRTNIVIKIPGTSQGDMIYEMVREDVIRFWKEFYMLSGAHVQIEEL